MRALPELHVVAAVLEDDAGRVLVSRRAARGEHPSVWEFPGGKVEAGEDARSALRRELIEELGIEAEAMRRVHRVRWPEARRTLVLDGWRVRIVRGEPAGLQGQPLRWVPKQELAELDMPPADAPLCSALRLDEILWITPPLRAEQDLPEWLRTLDAKLDAGVRLLQLRLPGVDRERLLQVAAVVAGRCRTRGARWLLNGGIEDAIAAGADGVHFSAEALRRLDAGIGNNSVMRLSWTGLDGNRLLLGASCHDADELARCARHAFDYATLSPLRATPSHPDIEPLGEKRFAELVRQCPLPIFALGGVGRADLEHVRSLGAFGVAGIHSKF